MAENTEEKTMCEQCSSLEKKQKKNFGWLSASLILTVVIFIVSQVFLYGNIVERINYHIETDPTHKELTEEFVRKDELQLLKEKLDLIYEILKDKK